MPDFNREPFFFLEIILISIVLFLQLFHSFKLYGKIKSLSTIFRNKFSIKTGYSDETTKEMVMTPLIFAEKGNETNERIESTLNSYLSNNFGAPVNFSIIKDIIDREVEVEDEAISEAIPFPLYLGLAATMLGIIFGLISMPSIEGEGFSEGINSLIKAVKWAMVASLFGLICTTILSTFFYKNAKKVVIREKNDLLSYLQANLLPELIKAEDTGFSGLRASIDKFTREATVISRNVMEAVEKTHVNLLKQDKIISKVDKMDMLKLSDMNLQLFDRFDNSMETFYEFSRYLDSMSRISENLVNFSNKTKNIETIANEINSTLSKSQDVLDFLRDHSKALMVHIKQIESSGGAAEKAVVLADSTFREAIDDLKLEIINRMSSLNNLSDTVDSNLTETFNNIGFKLENVTEKHLNTLTETYNNSTPHFENLNHLNLLPEIRDNANGQSVELINVVKQLNASLGFINNQMGNKEILSRLDSIEISLKRKASSSKTPVVVKEKRAGIIKRIRNKFSRRVKIENSEEE